MFAAALKQLCLQTLSRDELYTLFQECAAVVNMTPLYEVSSSPSDPVSISPAMLLTMKSFSRPPSLEKYTSQDILAYGSRRWRRVQYLVEQFWVRWRRNFLFSLQSRNKWKFQCRRPKVGDVVLLRNSSNRNEWPIARVEAVKTSSDGLARSSSLLVASNKGQPRKLERCIQDTILLAPNEE